MIEFEEAVEVAKENAQNLIKSASNFVLEGVLISDDGKLYEVALSYELTGVDPLSGDSTKTTPEIGGLMQLARVMSRRREYKTFLVDIRTGKFRGFSNSKR